MLGHVIDGIWSSSDAFRKFSFGHVKRKDNQLTHSFASRAVLSTDLVV